MDMGPVSDQDRIAHLEGELRVQRELVTSLRARLHAADADSEVLSNTLIEERLARSEQRRLARGMDPKPPTVTVRQNLEAAFAIVGEVAGLVWRMVDEAVEARRGAR